MNAEETYCFIKERFRIINKKKVHFIYLNELDTQSICLDFKLCQDIERVWINFNKEDFKKITIKNGPKEIHAMFKISDLSPAKNIELDIQGKNVRRINLACCNIHKINLNTPFLSSLNLPNNSLQKIEVESNYLEFCDLSNNQLLSAEINCKDIKDLLLSKNNLNSKSLNLSNFNEKKLRLTSFDSNFIFYEKNDLYYFLEKRGKNPMLGQNTGVKEKLF